MTTLLLVDSSVAGYQQIVAAAKESVIVVVFDRKTDTYASLLAKVAAVGVPAFKTAGIVQHGDSFSSNYSILDTETPTLLSEASAPEPTMPSWTGLIGFFSALKTTYTVEITDLISCSLLANPLWIDALNQLEVRTEVNFRASADATGNLANGGNWVQESDNVNIQDIYFTDAISEYASLLYNVYSYRYSSQIVDASNNVSFPMITPANPVNGMTIVSTPSSIITWGDANKGGDSSGVSSELVNIVSIASTQTAFAAITDTGTVVTWGDTTYGGNSSSVASQLTNVVKIASTATAFAALRSDGKVVTWGFAAQGGDSSSVSGQLQSGVVAIAATSAAFAALKNNGTVVTWGLAGYGGDSSGVSGELVNVVALASNIAAFAAIKDVAPGVKNVVTWGISSNGGDSSGVSGELVDVYAIASTESAFAALKTVSPGVRNVVTWGGLGGNSSGVSGELIDVVAIASTRTAFAALRSNKRVVPWGSSAGGGTNNTGVDLDNIRAIASTYTAYAAIRTDASGAGVALWGSFTGGGSNNTGANISSNVQTIASSFAAFSAIKTDGTVQAWGLISGSTIDTSAVQAQLTDVTEIISTENAFSALKADSSVVSWGSSSFGGNQTTPVDVSGQLNVRIIAVASNQYAFAAFKEPETNMFPLRVNPFLTLDTVIVYTQEAIDALAAGLPLPTTSRVSWAPAGMPAGSLLRDLNRSVVVKVSPTNPLHAYRFQRIQLIRGPDTEGVGGSPTETDAWQTGYICVWAASGTPPIYV